MMARAAGGLGQELGYPHGQCTESDDWKQRSESLPKGTKAERIDPGIPAKSGSVSTYSRTRSPFFPQETR